MLHEEITGAVIDASFEVMNELGVGFLESVYRRALQLVLEEKGLSVEGEVPLEVFFRGRSVGVFQADLMVERKVIVELKVASSLTPAHQAQVINYLQATGVDVGLLVNFGKAHVEHRRVHRPRPGAPGGGLA